MSKPVLNAQDSLQGLAGGDLTMLNVLASMIEGTFEESGLEPKTFLLVRMAALATLNAPPASWLMNIEAASEAGLEPESILGTLIAIAPVVGTARIVSAAGHIMQAYELAEGNASA
jgi:alkylhydroperoxidase/carboxymuconolactone decarboxylase family protein YurZ